MRERRGGPEPGHDRGPDDVTDPPIGPMSLGIVVEAATRILRSRFAVLLALSLLIVGPGVLLTASVELSLTDVMADLVPLDAEGRPVLTAPLLSRDDVDRVIGAAAGFLAASAVAGLLGAIAALGFSAVVAMALRRRPMSLGAALRACLRRAPTAFGVVLVTSLVTIAIIGVGMLLAALSIAVAGGAMREGGPGVFVALVVGVATVVAVVYLSVRWSMALPVAVLEDVGTRPALVRTWELTRDNVWRTFAVVAGATLVTVVFGAFIAQVLALVLVDLLARTVGLDEGLATTAASAVASIAVAPIAPVLAAILYHDLRVRRQGSQPTT